MKQQQPNRFISRAAAMTLLTLVMAFAGAQTAGATVRTVTYTIGYSSGNGYYLAGDDGTQSSYFDTHVETTLNLALGSDVTIHIASAYGNVLRVGDLDVGYHRFAGFDRSIDNDIDVTVTSQSHYVCHFKMIGLGKENYARVQTSMETFDNLQSSTLNWRSNSNNGNSNGFAGKFIVSYSDSPAYRITYELNGGTNAAANPEWYERATGVASLADPTDKAGYDFGGWYDNAGFNGTPITSIAANSTGAMTLYAKWTAHTYTITYYPNGARCRRAIAQATP